MKVLGIDPGYERLGIAIIEQKDGQNHLLFSDCLITPRDITFADRLKLIGAKIDEVIETWRPSILAIENLFITKNQKTAMKVSEVRGVAIYLAADKNLKVFEYTPMEIKLTITGYGKADKNQITSMVKKLVLVPNKKIID